MDDNGPEVHCCVHLGSGCDTHEPTGIRGFTKIHSAAENRCSQIFESESTVVFIWVAGVTLMNPQV
jgi:hypothetical protein